MAAWVFCCCWNVSVNSFGFNMIFIVEPESLRGLLLRKRQTANVELFASLSSRLYQLPPLLAYWPLTDFKRIS
jgi:hypothetical protein